MSDAELQVGKLAQESGEPQQRAVLSALRDFMNSAAKRFAQAELAQVWQVLVEQQALPASFCAELLVPTLYGLPKGPLRVRLPSPPLCFCRRSVSIEGGARQDTAIGMSTRIECPLGLGCPFRTGMSTRIGSR
jgi:hypothetical protein